MSLCISRINSAPSCKLFACRLRAFARVGVTIAATTAAAMAHAQTYTLSTLATFTAANGQYPEAGVTLDSSGNLYGTTYQGGANNDGTVFKLTLTGAVSAPEPSALALLLPALSLLFPCVRQRTIRSMQK